MLNRRHRTYLLTSHTNNIAGCIFSDGIERRGEAGILRANGNACPAFNAGAPVNEK